MKEQKEVIKYKQKVLIDLISDATGFRKLDCKTVLDIIPDCLNQLLQETSEDHDTEVALTNGIIIGSRYIPERHMTDPRNGNPIVVEAKTQPYGRFPESFKRKINE